MKNPNTVQSTVSVSCPVGINPGKWMSVVQAVLDGLPALYNIWEKLQDAMTTKSVIMDSVKPDCDDSCGK